MPDEGVSKIMDRLDLTTLRLFLIVAEHKNIARAAEIAHLAASAISKRISDLERDLDVVLLERGRNGVELTAAGIALLAHVQSINDLTDRLSAELSSFASGAKGLVRIAANPSSITQFLPPVLARFNALYPQIRIELLEEMSGRTIQLVSDRAVDIGIVADSVGFSDLEAYDFRRDKLAMLMPRGHPLQRHRKLSFIETLDYAQVGLAEGSSIQAILIAEARAAGRKLDLIARVASFDALRGLVAEQIGIACLPVGCIKPFLAAQNLAMVPLSDPWADRQLKVCLKPGARSEQVTRFVKELGVQFYSGEPPGVGNRSR
jgi:DNA-binding transcriptional LysR family regulator